ncbi:MAG: prephenate dehydrogenase/arogenate dehydrogenase family protein [Desulfobacteraceae bacterium]|jgi:prephenate dehydrogenase
MIGLIGYGRFGRLTVQNLSPKFKVWVHTRSAHKKQDITAAGGTLTTLEKVCAQKVVILCVPISAMQSTLKQIAPLLRPNAIVVDVCSVKVRPVQWMKELLPPSVEILATHPMFGPDSAGRSVTGFKVVLCPERIRPEHYEKIKLALRNLNLNLIETTADEHDQKIAVSLALTHFIGRSLAEFGAEPLDIDTEGYKRLLHILEVVNNDTWQLFEDIHRFNPYAGKKRQDFLSAMERVQGRIKKH